MAVKPFSAPGAAWNTQYDNYLSLAQRLELAAPPECEALEDAMVAVQDHLLKMPAPNVAAVRQKLEILWEAQLHGLDQNSRERCLILDDLSRLIQAPNALARA